MKRFTEKTAVEMVHVCENAPNKYKSNEKSATKTSPRVAMNVMCLVCEN